MPRLSFIAALFAAIILVIGGAPARAAAAACDPCPRDCPMMAKAAKAMADHHAAAPGKSSPTDDPCRPGPLCQAPAATAALPQVLETPVHLAATGDPPRPPRQLPAASRAPDRSLRPPIQL
jgi:hypothetical protein